MGFVLPKILIVPAENQAMPPRIREALVPLSILELLQRLAVAPFTEIREIHAIVIELYYRLREPWDRAPRSTPEEYWAFTGSLSRNSEWTWKPHREAVIDDLVRAGGLDILAAHLDAGAWDGIARAIAPVLGFMAKFGSPGVINSLVGVSSALATKRPGSSVTTKQVINDALVDYNKRRAKEDELRRGA